MCNRSVADFYFLNYFHFNGLLLHWYNVVAPLERFPTGLRASGVIGMILSSHGKQIGLIDSDFWLESWKSHSQIWAPIPRRHTIVEEEKTERLQHLSVLSRSCWLALLPSRLKGYCLRGPSPQAGVRTPASFGRTAHLLLRAWLWLISRTPLCPPAPCWPMSEGVSSKMSPEGCSRARNSQYCLAFYLQGSKRPVKSFDWLLPPTFSMLWF